MKVLELSQSDPTLTKLRSQGILALTCIFTKYIFIYKKTYCNSFQSDIKYCGIILKFNKMQYWKLKGDCKNYLREECNYLTKN
ncbi:unnamed protein product [Spodoptera exigua]|nr:unnamed protein product [Spodoptera exigua]